jgi:protein transport protein DSL1/ZW10
MESVSAFPYLSFTDSLKDTLYLEGQADRSVDALLSDLEKLFLFLSQRLPADLLQSLCAIMMDDIIPKLLHVWLDLAVPASLKDIGQFEEVIHSTNDFCTVLEKNGLSGFDALKEWVSNAPSIWLSKCRATALDSVRSKLSHGIGQPKQVEKIEKQMVTRSEGKELAANGPATAAAADDDDWGAAWGDEDEEPTNDGEFGTSRQPPSSAVPEDDGADAWGWDAQGNMGNKTTDEAKESAEDDEDSAAAWGWGDDGDVEVQTDPTSPKKPSAPIDSGPEKTRELILKETYNISSMPEPVLELILAILEDGASLTQAGSGFIAISRI